ncbi:MAG: hypothetical protein QY326_00340 [Bdellovibrionota bacterium]|nr:MAG: hypothetical protein QY326_00340 [Bdellovibrionota bacterium]
MDWDSSNKIPTVRDLMPPWIFTWRPWEQRVMAMDELMPLLIAVSAENVRLGPARNGGGPYAAAVVRNVTSAGDDLPNRAQVISLAANAVEAMHDASAHASVLAARLAASTLGRHLLDEDGEGGKLWLVATCEPCRMCLEVLGDFHLWRIAYALRGAQAKKLADQERGEPLRNGAPFRLHHLSTFQPSAAEVVRQWKSRQQRQSESDYNPPREEG